MSHLEIALLGRFRVALDGAEVTRFGADTARALLAYLALHMDSPCRRETLAGLLWPDQPETEARHNLRTALRFLGQPEPPAALVRPGDVAAFAAEHWSTALIPAGTAIPAARIGIGG